MSGQMQKDFGVMVSDSCDTLQLSDEDLDPSLLNQLIEPKDTDAEAVVRKWEAAMKQVSEKMMTTTSIMHKQNEQMQEKIQQLHSELASQQSKNEDIKNKLDSVNEQ